LVEAQTSRRARSRYYSLTRGHSNGASGLNDFGRQVPAAADPVAVISAAPASPPYSIYTAVVIPQMAAVRLGPAR